jgi:copper chaperone CopZ
MNELRFMVSGMCCGHCASAITVALSELSGVASVDIDVTSAWVIVCGQGFKISTVQTAVNKTGHVAEL